jgi:hypothetical protein
MQAQLCAAFHRGVALQPDVWDDESKYYLNEPYNYYSKYWRAGRALCSPCLFLTFQAGTGLI